MTSRARAAARRTRHAERVLERAATAAAGPSIGISPTPFAPLGPNGYGTSTRIVSRSGASANVGTMQFVMFALMHLAVLVDARSRAPPSRAPAACRPRSGPATITGLIALPTSTACTQRSIVDLVGVEIDRDVDEARGPAVHRVRRAGVGRVVPLDARAARTARRADRLPRRARGRARPASPAAGRRPASSSAPQLRPPPRRARRRPCTVRLATVGPLSGTCAVVGSIDVDPRRTSTPSAAAAICVKIVIAPWPMSVELDARPRSRPPASTRPSPPGEPLLARAGEARAVEVEARRRGRARDRRAGAPSAVARRRRSPRRRCGSRRCTSSVPTRRASTWPVAVVSPTAQRERARAARADRRPSGARLLSIWRSYGERGLRRAEAAERAVRRVVRRDDAAAHARDRAAVRPGRVQHAARQHDRRQRQVRAAVHHAVDVDREELARRVDREPMPRPAPGGASSSRRCPRRGRRRSSPAAAPPSRAARTCAASIDGYSSLPPNPPPVTDCVITTSSALAAEERLHRLVHVVRALHRADDVAAPARPTRPSSPAARCTSAPARRCSSSPTTTCRLRDRGLRRRSRDLCARGTA